MPEKGWLGWKHHCECGTKFYDLDRDKIVCPRCGKLFERAKKRFYEFALDDWNGDHVPGRFLFRITHIRNLKTYLQDGCIFANNHRYVQKCWRISHETIVNRRNELTTPCNSIINDFVSLYFSPATSMAFAIRCGNVSLRSPEGRTLGYACYNDVAFLVVDPDILFESGRKVWYTDIASNSFKRPRFEHRQKELENHVCWPLFDEHPRMARIDEIGYMGVCMQFWDQDEPATHRLRSKKRMAEFMIKDYLKMDEIACIIVRNSERAGHVRSWVKESRRSIPVYSKPGCYFE